MKLLLKALLPIKAYFDWKTWKKLPPKALLPKKSFECNFMMSCLFSNKLLTARVTAPTETGSKHSRIEHNEHKKKYEVWSEMKRRERHRTWGHNENKSNEWVEHNRKLNRRATAKEEKCDVWKTLLRRDNRVSNYQFINTQKKILCAHYPPSTLTHSHRDHIDFL